MIPGVLCETGLIDFSENEVLCGQVIMDRLVEIGVIDRASNVGAAFYFRRLEGGVYA